MDYPCASILAPKKNTQTARLQPLQSTHFRTCETNNIVTLLFRAHSWFNLVTPLAYYCQAVTSHVCVIASTTVIT